VVPCKAERKRCDLHVKRKRNWNLFLNVTVVLNNLIKYSMLCRWFGTHLRYVRWNYSSFKFTGLVFKILQKCNFSLKISIIGLNFGPI